MTNHPHPNFQIPEGGEELGVSIDGQLYIHPRNKKYLESISEKVKNPTQKQIEKSTVNHAGFSKNKNINKSKSTREETMERLVLNQAHEAWLLSQLEKVRSVISSLKKDLENN